MFDLVDTMLGKTDFELPYHQTYLNTYIYQPCITIALFQDNGINDKTDWPTLVEVQQAQEAIHLQQVCMLISQCFMKVYQCFNFLTDFLLCFAIPDLQRPVFQYPNKCLFNVIQDTPTLY